MKFDHTSISHKGLSILGNHDRGESVLECMFEYIDCYINQQSSLLKELMAKIQGLTP